MSKKLKCETCGKEFEQSEFDKMFPDKNPVNRFCSDDCYNLHNEFAYKLESAGFSSHQCGNCEVCGKHATEVFIQVKYKHYKFERNGKTYEGDSHQGTTFGHEQCLIEARKNQNKTGGDPNASQHFLRSQK